MTGTNLHHTDKAHVRNLTGPARCETSSAGTVSARISLYLAFPESVMTLNINDSKVNQDFYWTTVNQKVISIKWLLTLGQAFRPIRPFG